MCGKRTPIWTLYTRIFRMPQPSHELNAKEALRPIYEWNCQETYQTHPPWYPSRTPRNAKQSGLARTDETAPANDGDNFTPARASLLADKSEDSHASSHRRRARGRTLELLRGATRRPIGVQDSEGGLNHDLISPDKNNGPTAILKAHSCGYRAHRHVESKEP